MVTELFDFSDPRSVAAWRAIDDRVVGGVSRSRLRHGRTGHAVFEGDVSLAQDGGFASVRSSPAERGEAGVTICGIEALGDPGQFKLSLLTDDGFDSVNYPASFMTMGHDWRTISLPISSFRASFRGRDVPGAQALDPARIRQVGLLIAGRPSGSFALDIRRISLA